MNRVDHDLANAVKLQPGLLGSSPKVHYQVHHHAPGLFGYTEEKKTLSQGGHRHETRFYQSSTCPGLR